MRPIAFKESQRGITLFVGLIMLILITLIVTSAFSLSTTNLKSVGNMQAKDEAIAAANQAIEQVISSPFTTSPAAETINVDINNDGTVDYVASIAQPTCERATLDNQATKSSLGLGSAMQSVATFNTVWNITATVTDSKTGTKTIVQAGTRVLLTESQKNAVCI